MNDSTPGKIARQSAVETRYLIMPRDANPLGSAFGGLVMSLIDETASMTAVRHCARPVVTAAIDSLAFLAPIRVGDHLLLNAQVSYTGKRSLEVMVRVTRENPVTGESALATTAFLTFVPINDAGNPMSVPPLRYENDTDKERMERARVRVEARKAHRLKHEEFEQ
jgi:acyl-CoA hydrolase